MSPKALGSKRTPTLRKRPSIVKGEPLRVVKVGNGLPPVLAMQKEVKDMVDVLMGRVAPDMDFGVLTLMETADAYYARGVEMRMLLHEQEAEGAYGKDSMYYKFRVGALRDFIELAKAATDLGSRRLSHEQLLTDKEWKGRESSG